MYGHAVPAHYSLFTRLFAFVAVAVAAFLFHRDAIPFYLRKIELNFFQFFVCNVRVSSVHNGHNVGEGDKEWLSIVTLPLFFSPLTLHRIPTSE